MNPKLQNAAHAQGHFEVISLENGREVWRSPVMENKVLTGGLSIITAHHAGDTTNPLEITSLEIGDGDTAVSAGDTALVNMVLDGVTPAKVTPNGASLTIEFFVIDAELPDGTYNELGLRAGSVLYTRSLFSTPYVKVAGRDTIIRYTITYSAV